jgi:excinuclease UvrABC nuclease subunit
LKYITVNEDEIDGKVINPILLQNYAQAPNEGGLYFLYSLDLKMLYIGKAVNIKHRLSEYYRHGSHLYDVIHNVMIVQYIVVEDVVERDMLETYYINKYKTPLNRNKTFTYDSDRFNKLYCGDDEPIEEEGLG